MCDGPFFGKFLTDVILKIFIHAGPEISVAIVTVIS